MRRIVAVGIGSVLLAGTVAGVSVAAAGTHDGPVATGPMSDYAAAAVEFHVPEPLLLAYSYTVSGWDRHVGTPSADGGYGPMHLTSPDAVQPAGKGGTIPQREAELRADPARNTLARAAALLHLPESTLKTDVTANIRGGAALLAADAGAGHVPLPDALSDWYSPIAHPQQGPDDPGLANSVFSTLRTGVTPTPGTGSAMRLAPQPGIVTPKPPVNPVQPPKPECPSGLDCRFVPAAYAWDNKADPNDYGNYDPAHRPDDGNRIRYIVIHDTEGSYDGTVSWFQDPKAYTSAHYVVRSRDGAVTQMVRTGDLAWHAGNWNMNMRSVGIELEGRAVTGNTDYTDQMYRSAAALVRYLADRYDIPLDRAHILGHEDVANDNAYPASHWDPGPFFDWTRFMSLVRGRDTDADTPDAVDTADAGDAPGAPASLVKPAPDLVRIAPDHAGNRRPLHYCPGGGQPCQDVPAQPSNFAFLRTGPSDDAPLITNPVTKGGTDDIADWSDKAVAGRRYAIAGRQGSWTAVWYAGQKAWLHTADTRPAAGFAVTTTGTAPVPVFTLAVPDPSEYPAGVPSAGDPTPVKPLFTVPAGQRYQLLGRAQAAYYYARFDESNVAGNHTVVRGGTTYYLISLNHRLGYVRATDVTAG